MNDPESFHALKFQTWTGQALGPAVIAMGGVHGNEPCGTRALIRIAQGLEDGHIQLRRGKLTLLAIANPLAHAKGTRDGERNLNRGFVPRTDERVLWDYENKLVAQLAPVLASHDILLDLHSFESPGPAFAMMAPPSASPREPSLNPSLELDLARCLGVPWIIQGWLDVYDRLTAMRGKPQNDSGIGTNEYMRSMGGCALTLECGQHQDPKAIQVGEAAVLNLLNAEGMLASGLVRPDGAASARVIRLRDVFVRVSPGDKLAKCWQPFECVARGEPILIRAYGERVLAAYQGVIVFPNATAPVGEELVYLATPSEV